MCLGDQLSVGEMQTRGHAVLHAHGDFRHLCRQLRMLERKVYLQDRLHRQGRIVQLGRRPRHFLTADDVGLYDLTVALKTPPIAPDPTICCRVAEETLRSQQTAKINAKNRNNSSIKSKSKKLRNLGFSSLVERCFILNSHDSVC